MFGENLVRAFGRSVPDPWRNAIRSLTNPQLERGLQALLDEGSAHPPTLPQFLAACRKAPPQAHQPFEPLTGPTYDEFHRVGCVELLQFLSINTVPNSMIPALVRRKNEIASASRADENLQGLPQAEWKAELKPIYQGAFQRVFLESA
jgi:hypothetical protein